MEKFYMFLFFVAFTRARCQEIIVHPENATVNEGESKILRCELNIPVLSCIWTSNGTTSFRDVDRPHERATSEKAYLTLATGIAVHPKNITASEGNDIILQCKFYHVFEICEWFRNDQAIEITDRYRYTNAEFKTNNSKDCSIEITKFSKIDATSWKCSGICTSYVIGDDKCMSKTAYLTMVIPEPCNCQGNTGVILNIALSCTLAIIISALSIYCYRTKKGNHEQKTTVNYETKDISLNTGNKKAVAGAMTTGPSWSISAQLDTSELHTMEVHTSEEHRDEYTVRYLGSKTRPIRIISPPAYIFRSDKRNTNSKDKQHTRLYLKLYFLQRNRIFQLHNCFQTSFSTISITLVYF